MLSGFELYPRWVPLHIARTIVRNSAGDARVIWCIFSGYHP